MHYEELFILSLHDCRYLTSLLQITRSRSEAHECIVVLQNLMNVLSVKHVFVPDDDMRTSSPGMKLSTALSTERVAEGWGFPRWGLRMIET